MGIAWVFPGQGSQKAGMATGVLELPGARERFAAASALLGRDLLAICAGEGAEARAEPADLGDTRNTQPALFVLESLLVDGLKALMADEKCRSLIEKEGLAEMPELQSLSVTYQPGAQPL